MRYKVWATGHVVIPKPIRDASGIRPGDGGEVFERDDDLFIRKADPDRDAAARRGTR